MTEYPASLNQPSISFRMRSSDSTIMMYPRRGTACLVKICERWPRPFQAPPPLAIEDPESDARASRGESIVSADTKRTIRYIRGTPRPAIMAMSRALARLRWGPVARP
jgi:hypothetical protein